jgi:hypothetical protein
MRFYSPARRQSPPPHGSSVDQSVKAIEPQIEVI